MSAELRSKPAKFWSFSDIANFFGSNITNMFNYGLSSYQEDSHSPMDIDEVDTPAMGRPDMTTPMAATQAAATPSSSLRRSARIAKTDIAKSKTKEINIDFDEYLPVFIYSHAEFARITSSMDKIGCKSAFPGSGDMGTDFTRINNISELFTNVPEGMIAIDPIPSGYNCLCGPGQDEMFPLLISSFGGLKKWFEPGSLPYYNSIIKEPTIEYVIKTFYNSTKLYLENERINNYEMIFDINKVNGIPWNIRTLRKVEGGEEITEELFEWTRQYSVKNNNCIYLNELIKKLEYERRNNRESPFYGRKLALIFLSCRPYPKESVIERMNRRIPGLKQDLLYRYNIIKELGFYNTSLLRPIREISYRPDIGVHRSAVMHDTRGNSCSLVKYSPVLEYIERNTLQIAQEITKRPELKGMYELWSQGMRSDEELELAKIGRLRGGRNKKNKITKKVKKKSHNKRSKTNKKSKKKTYNKRSKTNKNSKK